MRHGIRLTGHSMVLIIALADKKGLRIGQQEHTKSARKHTKSARDWDLNEAYIKLKEKMWADTK